CAILRNDLLSSPRVETVAQSTFVLRDAAEDGGSSGRTVIRVLPSSNGFSYLPLKYSPDPYPFALRRPAFKGRLAGLLSRSRGRMRWGLNRALSTKPKDRLRG